MARPQLRGLGNTGGYVPVQQIVRDIRAAQPLSHNSAQTIADYAFSVIESAIDTGEDRDLPGGTARKNVYDHLAWHNMRIGEGYDRYPHDDDLVKWAAQAVIELNAVLAGIGTIADSRVTVVRELWQAAKDAPRLIGTVLGEVASGVGEVAGKTTGGFLSGLGSNPFGLAVLIGAGYLVLTAMRRA